MTAFVRGGPAYIGNPAAAHGKAASVVADIALAAGAAGHAGPVLVTTRPGEATDLARRAADAGASIVVAVGGDGTAGEVAEGLAGTPTALGIIPAGGGNDLARVFGIPRLRPGPAALATAIRHVIEAPRGQLDLIELGGRGCLQAGGAGLDAHVTGMRARSRIRPASLAYGASAVLGLLTWRRQRMRVILDGRVAYDAPAFAVTIANVSTYGGGLRIVPGADPTDGLLDVAIIGDIGSLEAVRLFPSVYRGAHVGHPHFHLLRGSTVRIESPDGQVPVHVDGSLVGSTPVEGRVRPGCVSVSVPRAEWDQLP